MSVGLSRPDVSESISVPTVDAVDRAVVHQRAVDEHDHPRCQADDVTQPMADEQHRPSGADHIMGSLFDDRHAAVAEHGGGFVEGEHPRVMTQRRRQRQRRPLRLAQPGDRGVGAVPVQRGIGDHPCRRPLGPTRAPAAQPAVLGEEDVLPRRHRRSELRLLGDVHDASRPGRRSDCRTARPRRRRRPRRRSVGADRTGRTATSSCPTRWRPTTATTSPANTARSTPSRATVPGNDLGDGPGLEQGRPGSILDCTSSAAAAKAQPSGMSRISICSSHGTHSSTLSAVIRQSAASGPGICSVSV